MKPKVFIYPFMSKYEKVIQILEPVAEIGHIDSANRERYREQLAIAEGIIGWGINEEILQIAPRLKVVAKFGVGYDDSDLEAMTRHKVYLTHTPGVLSDSVADLTMALLLACNRKIVQADRYVREGWANRAPGSPTYGVDLKGKTLGIVGLGRIGFEVAKRCVNGFNMRLIYYDLYHNQRAEKELGAEFVTLEEVMMNSDFISINVALTHTTQRMIGEAQLRMMKKTAYLINTARGKVIDQTALVKILSEKAIAGAGLDVFEKEPIPLDDPLLKLQNVVLSPHLGVMTEETMESIAICDAENIAAVIKGEIPPPNVVPEQREMIFKK